MAMKIALIAALCIAQGFAHKPFFGKAKEPCKHPRPASAEVITHEFEEALEEMDSVRDTVSTAMMESYFKGFDPQVIVACFNQERENYAKLGQDMAQKIREGAEEIAKDLGDKYEEYAKEIAEPMEKIADTMKMLPQRMWEYMKELEFKKALEVYRQSRRIIEENGKKVAEITKEFTEELPETAEKAEKIAQEIREEARKGCREIGVAFKKCVEAGGPKGPVEQQLEVEA